jgi:hypothetical protein
MIRPFPNRGVGPGRQKLVGGGRKRIFRDAAAPMPLRLVSSQVTATGAILATYAPAEG